MEKYTDVCVGGNRLTKSLKWEDPAVKQLIKGKVNGEDTQSNTQDFCKTVSLCAGFSFF